MPILGIGIAKVLKALKPAKFNKAEVFHYDRLETNKF
jgi:hypothetical protein